MQGGKPGNDYQFRIATNQTFQTLNEVLFVELQALRGVQNCFLIIRRLNDLRAPSQWLVAVMAFLAAIMSADLDDIQRSLSRGTQALIEVRSVQSTNSFNPDGKSQYSSGWRKITMEQAPTGVAEYSIIALREDTILSRRMRSILEFTALPKGVDPINSSNLLPTGIQLFPDRPFVEYLTQFLTNILDTIEKAWTRRGHCWDCVVPRSRIVDSKLMQQKPRVSTVNSGDELKPHIDKSLQSLACRPSVHNHMATNEYQPCCFIDAR
ncbi:hypothetical protein T265_04359 [Opisthorchis viverrini]|uniref:Uncharacterized protein n=1 Tax=Opisthorchis viverrini TaxID=6198 RepID=A0A074ZNB7_OPIVI|nr:hypothetical protein T265_04359 [Opisthorchis viverrini]KER28893.1 hypothetical protein T265_04359 [Opisthorchis viverrini]